METNSSTCLVSPATQTLIPHQTPAVIFGLGDTEDTEDEDKLLKDDQNSQDHITVDSSTNNHGIRLQISLKKGIVKSTVAPFASKKKLLKIKKDLSAESVHASEISPDGGNGSLAVTEKRKQSNENSSSPTKKKKKKKDSSKKDDQSKSAYSRKNIRKILSEETLSEEVKEAQRLESERLKRVSEKEKIPDNASSCLMRLLYSNDTTSSDRDSIALDLNQPANKLSRQSSSDLAPKIASPETGLFSQALASPIEPTVGDDKKEAISERSLFFSQSSTFPNKMLFNSSISNSQRLDSTPVLNGPSFLGTRVFDDQRTSEDKSSAMFHLKHQSLSAMLSSRQNPPDLKFTTGKTSDDPILLEDSDEEDKDGIDSDGEIDLNQINLPDENGRVLINKGHPDTEEDYFLTPRITSTIKPHQIGGIRFLYNNVVESVSQFNTTSGFGCILAHSMGLGKTIQVVSFLDVLFRHVKANNALVIVPINTIQNWQAEIDAWLPETLPKSNQSQTSLGKDVDQSPITSTSGSVSVTHNSLDLPNEQMAKESLSQSQDTGGPMETGNAASTSLNGQSEKKIAGESADTNNGLRPFTLYVIRDHLKTVEARHQVISSWQRTGGVLLIGYEMFRLLVVRRGSKTPRRTQSSNALSSLSSNMPFSDSFGCNGGTGNIHHGSMGSAASFMGLDSMASNSSRSSMSSAFGSEVSLYSANKKNVVLDAEAERKKAAMFKDFYEALIDPGPQVVICDEGHRIKNSEASISKALKSVKTKRRVVMTGYPLQNNLLEYWCMVDFVRPNYLGSKIHFVNMFQRPIENGQCVDSTLEDRKLMQGRAHVLHDMLSGFVQRRSQAVLQASLPPKREMVLLVKMSPVQRALYAALLCNIRAGGGVTENAAKDPTGAPLTGGWTQSNTLKTYAVCCKIWNHPDILYQAVQKQTSSSSVDPFDFDIEDLTASASPSSGPVTKPVSKPSRAKRKAPNGSHSQGSSQNESGISYHWTKLIPEWNVYQPYLRENGGKIPLLLSLVEKSVGVGDRLLVFSQSLLSLDVVEMFLNRTPLALFPWERDPSMGNALYSSTQCWTKNDTYYREFKFTFWSTKFNF